MFELAIVIGIHPPQNDLFSYCINLNQRVRDNHPLRKIHEVVDFQFVRVEVDHTTIATRGSCQTFARVFGLIP